MRNFTNANKNGPSGTKTDTWITPKWIIDKIGISDLDPCGFLKDGRPIVETAKNYCTGSAGIIDDDGLLKDWSNYESVFVNFPYSESKLWLKKCSEEYLLKSENSNIIVLCFVRSDTQAWQKYVKNYSTGINLINKRISFLDCEGSIKSNGNAPSCLIAYGEKAFERIKSIDGILFKQDNS